MRLIRGLSLALVVLPVLTLPIYAKADTLVYGLTEGETPTVFTSGNGIADAVVADQTMTIDSFGFDLKQTAGGTVDYFILDATTSSFLLSPTAVPGVPTGMKQFTLLDLTGPGLTLNAGDLYYFGVFGSGTKLTVNLSPQDFFGDGLSLATSPTPTSITFDNLALSSSFDGPTNDAGFSENEASLRIFSNDAPGVTPEPSSLVLMGTGILAAAGAMRRRVKA
jgi:PEP-CTERM motif